jgi:hypothetical protein
MGTLRITTATSRPGGEVIEALCRTAAGRSRPGLCASVQTAAGNAPKVSSMNAPTPSPARFGGLNVRHSMVMAVIAVSVVFFLAAGVLAFWREDGPIAPERANAETQGQPLLAPLRARCETCGVIERIRPIEAIGAAPASYEFAVRLPDGSLRFSSDPNPGQWKVGDRMQLLGGERTWSASP